MNRERGLETAVHVLNCWTIACQRMFATRLSGESHCGFEWDETLMNVDSIAPVKSVADYKTSILQLWIVRETTLYLPLAVLTCARPRLSTKPAVRSNSFNPPSPRPKPLIPTPTPTLPPPAPFTKSTTYPRSSASTETCSICLPSSISS
jgi:hypothetical protein